MTFDPRPEVTRRLSRLARATPGLRALTRPVDAARAQRDEARGDRDRYQAQVGQLRQELKQLRSDSQRSPAKVLAAPSILARTEALRRVRSLSRERNGHADAIWRYNDKRAGTELARTLGIAVPEHLFGPIPINSIQPPRDRPFVVKPLNGASARGVLALVPQPDGGFLDLFDVATGPRSWDEHVTELSSVLESGRISDEFVGEELIPGPTSAQLPYDWKLLCIGGRVALAYGMARSARSPNEARYRYFSPSWDDLGPIRNADRIDASIPQPTHGSELIAAAERIARSLPVLFVRVDLFERPEGVVFGEITPQPGPKLWFGAELDRVLGEQWDVAEADSWAT